jgi:adenylosuccinate synthase
MSDILDLDAILPEPRQVKLNGKTYTILPAKLKDFIAIQKLFLSFQDVGDPTKQVSAIEEITKVLKPIIPNVEEMDVTFEQLLAILQFSYNTAAPKNTGTPGTEKKT